MKKMMWTGSLAVLFAALGLAAVTPFTAWAGELLPGIYIGGIDLGGMTEEEAELAIRAHVDDLSRQTITLDLKDEEFVTTASELGFFWNNPEAVEETARIVSGGNLVARYMKRKDLEKMPIMIPIEISVDEEKVSEFVEKNGEDLIEEPSNAAIVRENDQFIVTPGTSGESVDVAATTEVLNDALAKGLEEPVRVTAVVTLTEPVIKESDLMTIQDVLGSFSTDFSSSGAARSKNLQAGSSKINGTILMPGETLSGYECMQPFTKANGYYTAAAYENGMVVDSVGGGVCQIATTLYNTALLAELEITQRQNHSMIVTYVKPSHDAAIAGTYKDIKITNNYSTPIYVEGGTSGRTLTFTIYGKETRPENRQIKYVSEVLGSTDPGAPTTRVDNSMAPGARRQVQSAHRGLRSRLWKCVYIDGVETEKTLLHTDNYMASKAVVLVGPEAPAVSAEIEASPVNPDLETEVRPPIEGVHGGPGATQAVPPVTPYMPAVPSVIAPEAPGGELDAQN